MHKKYILSCCLHENTNMFLRKSGPTANWIEFFCTIKSLIFSPINGLTAITKVPVIPPPSPIYQIPIPFWNLGETRFLHGKRDFSRITWSLMLIKSRVFLYCWSLARCNERAIWRRVLHSKNHAKYYLVIPAPHHALSNPTWNSWEAWRIALLKWSFMIKRIHKNPT